MGFHFADAGPDDRDKEPFGTIFGSESPFHQLIVVYDKQVIAQPQRVEPLPYIDSAVQISLMETLRIALLRPGWRHAGLLAQVGALEKNLGAMQTLQHGGIAWHMILTWRGRDPWESLIEGEQALVPQSLSILPQWFYLVMFIARFPRPAMDKPGGQWFRWMTEGYGRTFEYFRAKTILWLALSNHAQDYRDRTGLQAEAYSDEMEGYLHAFWQILRLTSQESDYDEWMNSFLEVTRPEPAVMQEMYELSRALWSVSDSPVSALSEQATDLLGGILPIYLWNNVDAGPWHRYYQRVSSARDFASIDMLTELWRETRSEIQNMEPVMPPRSDTYHYQEKRELQRNEGRWDISSEPFPVGLALARVEATVRLAKDVLADIDGQRTRINLLTIATLPDNRGYRLVWRHKDKLIDVLAQTSFPLGVDDEIRTICYFIGMLGIDHLKQHQNYDKLVSSALPLLCDGLLNSLTAVTTETTPDLSRLEYLEHWLATKQLPTEPYQRAQIFLRNLEALWTQEGMRMALESHARFASEVREHREELGWFPHLCKTWLLEQSDGHISGYIEAINTFADCFNRLTSRELIETRVVLWGKPLQITCRPHLAWEYFSALAGSHTGITQEECNFLTMRDQVDKQRSWLTREQPEERPEVSAYRYAPAPTENQRLLIEATVSRNRLAAEDKPLNFRGSAILKAPYLDPGIYPLTHFALEDDYGDSIESAVIMPIDELRLVIKETGIVVSIVHDKVNAEYSLAYWEPASDSIGYVSGGYNASALRIILSGIWCDAHVLDRRVFHDTSEGQADVKRKAKQKQSGKRVVSLPRYQYVEWGSEQDRKAIREYAEHAKRRLHEVRGHERLLPEGWHASEECRELYEELVGEVLSDGKTWVRPHTRGTGEAARGEDTRLYCRGLRSTIITLLHILGDPPSMTSKAREQ